MRYVEPTSEQRLGWEAWVAELPDLVRTIALKFDPWTLYRMKSTDQRVTVAAFDVQENNKVTLRVNVSGEFNFVTLERSVFGIDPDNLEECDLPSMDESLGTTDWPIEVVKEMRDRFPDGKMPDEVKKDLLAKFPVRTYPKARRS